MQDVIQKEEVLFSDVVKERVSEIKMKKYQGELVINEILNVLNTSEKNLHSIENQNLISRSIKTIFGSNKKLVKNNEKNLVTMQKMSLELLHALIEANVVNTDLVKDVIKELGDIRSDNYEIASSLKKLVTNYGKLQVRVKTVEDKLNLHDMITKIEYGAYDKEDNLFTILEILRELDPCSIATESQIDLLRRCVNRYVLSEDGLEPLNNYLVKISRMENLKAEKICRNLEISEDNPVVHAVVDSLEFASTHNELQKKFQFTVTTLKDITTYIDVNEMLTVTDLMNLIIEAMLLTYQNSPQIEDVENIDILDVQEEHDELYFDLFKDIIIKNYKDITSIYHFYKYSEDDIKDVYFSYNNFLTDIAKKPFTDFINQPINVVVFNLACIFGEIDIINQIDTRHELINYQNPESQMTPLMYAASFGRLEVVQYLLGYEAYINYETVEHKTALIYAIENNFIKVAKHLIDCGSQLAHKELYHLAYEKSLDDIIHKMEKHYFQTFKNGEQDIIDILLKHIPKIAQNNPHEIVKNVNEVPNHVTNSLKFISQDDTTIDDVIALIDTSRFKSGKEGILFTYRGFYVRIKNISFYQPYFIIEDVEYDKEITVVNSIDTQYKSHPIKKVVNMKLDKLNQTELFKMLLSLKELVLAYLK